MRRQRPLCASFLVVFLAILTATPCAAAKWEEVGNSGVTLDKSYVDLDSIKSSDGLKMASIMTVYAAPRLNTNNILLDRHVQVTAFDCEHHRFIGVQTLGYLNGKQVGHSPETTDWRNRLIPIPADALSTRTLNLVCNASAAGGGTASGAAPSQTVAKVSTGSGIIVDSDGFVLTNVHVVTDCKTLAVKVPGSPATVAAIEAVDPKNDLALLRSQPSYGVPAEFRAESRPVRLGESIGVIGYPLPGILSNEPKATFGQINSVAGLNNDYTLLQISAPVQPGNSGGPVFDESGSVVGIIVSEASPALAAKIGIMPQNVNFAIRGELAQIFMSAHGVRYSVSSSRRRLQTEEIAAAGQNSAVQVICLKR